MSEHELRSLAESYIEAQLTQANASVSPEKRNELVESALRIVDPNHGAEETAT